MTRYVSIFVVFLALCDWCCLAEDALTPADRTFFENKIRPVLVQHCYGCHSVDAEEVGGKLLLDSRDAMLKGGESGPVFVAAKPNESLLIEALRYGDLAMPPEAPLPEAVINDFVSWIERGAPDPRTEATAVAESQGTFDREALWSFLPRQNPAPPNVSDPSWPKDPLDHFVQARFESAGLQPSKDASPRVLIQRLSIDLIGLLPTHRQITDFEDACRVDRNAAIERLVDRLLNSPQFGVRWGRHWLDVARYGESNGDDGLGRNASFPHAWRYRDYVIDAFNNDTPYDRFLIEQLAGDLLPAESASQRNRLLTATGFLAIGSKPAAAMNQNFAMDIVDDQINAVCSATLGLSVACARCHDHKHDPIPTSDYYALAGIFASTETLYGAAGNEKLTAPPTPLHELTEHFNAKQASERKPHETPKFPEGYADAILKLQPNLYASLESAPSEWSVEGTTKFSPEAFAETKNAHLRGELGSTNPSYSVAFWFKNELPNTQSPVTAYLFTRGEFGNKQIPGDHLGIGGSYSKERTGRLFVFNGNSNKQSVGGNTVIAPKSWNHVVLVRQDQHIRVYLNGRLEIDEDLPATFGESLDYCFAVRSDKMFPLSGNLGQVATFERSLSDDEAIVLHAASGQPRPPAVIGMAMGVREAKAIANSKIHINGDKGKLGPEIPRQMLSAYSQIDPLNERLFSDEELKIDGSTSGRLQLARWITQDEHPQTARVMVNRIWLHLFGRGIVTTPDDFGVYGAQPTHPLLLDHLAQRFVDSGWSIKQFIRAVVLSRTYQLDSHCDPTMLAADPENIFFARHSRRRLDAESLRDSILLACGQLDFRPGEGSDIQKRDLLINKLPEDASDLHRPSNHRSLYLCMLRHAPPKELSAFDLPDGVTVVGQRSVTTLPAHGLFLLNSPFVVQQAQRLAAHVLQSEKSDDAARVHAVFQNILRREPTEHEQRQAIAFVIEFETSLPSEAAQTQREQTAWAAICQALLTTNEFRYVD